MTIVSGAENRDERAESQVSGSGVVSGCGIENDWVGAKQGCPQVVKSQHRDETKTIYPQDRDKTETLQKTSRNHVQTETSRPRLYLWSRARSGTQEQWAGVTETDLSAERLFCRSSSVHMCSDRQSYACPNIMLSKSRCAVAGFKMMKKEMYSSLKLLQEAISLML